MKKKIAYLLLLLMLIPVGSFAKEKRTFEIKDGHFYVNGKVTPILSGEMHYPRIPHQYWRHRLRMMRAMGLNTVATYVFWNLHETEPGKWDFEGDKNLAEYIRIAGEEELMVILRPGPYVCAEWEFGSYVAQRKDIPLEEHRRYNAKVKRQLADAGFNVPLFISDGSWLFEGGSTPGALPTANGESNVENLKKVVNSIRNVIRKYVTYDVPEAPAPIPLIEIPSISLTKVADVLALAKEGEPVASPTPLTFEQLNQGYGYVLYSTHFNQPLKGRLEIPGLRDYATIYVDGERVGELNRCFNQYAMEIDIPFNATLDILVENMGRINYGEEIVRNTKGIISPVKTPVLTKLKKITAMEKKNRLMEKTVSPFSVDETMRRIEEIIKSQGGSVFAVFDHGRNASEVGMKLPPNKVIVFGSPKVGTLLMQQDPSISLELPLRISVWEDADGKVWIGSPNLETIASEYGMENSGVIEKMQEAVTNIVSKSIAGSR